MFEDECHGFDPVWPIVFTLHSAAAIRVRPITGTLAQIVRGDAKESAYLPDEVDTGTGVTVDRFDLTETERMGRSSMGALLAV